MAHARVFAIVGFRQPMLESGLEFGPYRLCWWWSRTFGSGHDGTWSKQPTGGKTGRIFPVFEVKKEIYAKLLVKTLVLLEVRIWFEQIRSFRHFCCLPSFAAFPRLPSHKTTVPTWI